jgi:hypothetical protein
MEKHGDLSLRVYECRTEHVVALASAAVNRHRLAVSSQVPFVPDHHLKRHASAQCRP